MKIKIRFYSYFKELAGSDETEVDLPHGITLNDLLSMLAVAFPRLAPMRSSALMAVGVDYQDRSYMLKEGDEVSLFPPVQGG
jgi:MoaD family protein